jgi:hypothetical protein
VVEERDVDDLTDKDESEEERGRTEDDRLEEGHDGDGSPTALVQSGHRWYSSMSSLLKC